MHHFVELDFFRVIFALSWRCLPVAAVEEEAVEKESMKAVPPGSKCGKKDIKEYGWTILFISPGF